MMTPESRMELIASRPDLPETPCYLFDAAMLRSTITDIRTALPHCNALCFAMKANPFLISMLDGQVDRFEVCSPGEYEICVDRGIDPEKLIISGVNKTEASMRRILGCSGSRGIYTIESPMHYEILSRLAAELDLNLHVMIRLSSGNQFGVDRESFCSIAAQIAADPHLTLCGLHYFSGTQKKMKKIGRELAMLEEFGAELREKFDLPRLELEYGPGLAVSYFEGDKILPATEQLKQLEELLANLRNYDRIGIEMGRFIASDCGMFLTKVVDLKQTEGDNYVIVDGGIHQLHYFGQMMGMMKPAIRQMPCREETDRYILCGSLCTVNDVLVRDMELGTLQTGDLLVFGKCGAYSMTEGSALFLSRELPAVYEYTESGLFRCLRTMRDTHLFNTQTN